MHIVGVTGVMGSGKSTVCALLAALGARHLDADQLARQAIAPGTPGFDRVVARFGRQILDGEGHLIRSRLAQLAFADQESLGDLEAIIHPQVARLQAKFLAGLAGEALVVLEIPLLFETGAQGRCDRTIAVACGGGRLTDRPGALPEVVARMNARQLPEGEKCRRADHVIDNRGPLAATRQQVAQLWPRLTAAPARVWPGHWRPLLQEAG